MDYYDIADKIFNAKKDSLELPMGHVVRVNYYIDNKAAEIEEHEDGWHSQAERDGDCLTIFESGKVDDLRDWWYSGGGSESKEVDLAMSHKKSTEISTEQQEKIRGTVNDFLKNNKWIDSYDDIGSAEKESIFNDVVGDDFDCALKSAYIDVVLTEDLNGDTDRAIEILRSAGIIVG
ncbi:hypothetical protein [Dialister invisus]|uniref:hypothetical protein n=1 Tax=Dialister invisus TaxID=218538 RepID=UPI002671103B|nr:hypothetical protein [Dialister invisus]